MHLDDRCERRPLRRSFFVSSPRPLALTVLALLVGCGGGGDSGSGTTPPVGGGAAPTATVTFPPSGVVTDGASILVRGGAASSASLVASVEVGGTAATTVDGFANWIAQVPLAQGVSPLSVRTEDVDGRVDSSAAEVLVARVPRILQNPVGVAYDGTQNDLMLFDSATGTILRVDGQSGDAVEFATGYEQGRVMAVQALPAPRLLLTSSNLGDIGGTPSGGVLAFPLTGGPPTELTGPNAGSGPRLDDPLGIAINAGLGVAYVADGATGEVFEIRLTDGLRTIVDTTGDGIRGQAGVAFDLFNGGLVVTTDREGRALLRFDLATFTRVVLSDDANGLGPAFVEPLGVIYDPLGARYLVADAGLGAIFAVNPSTGDRTVISGSETGGGPPLTQPIALVQNPGGRLFVADARTAALLEIDLPSGNRNAVYATSFGTGPLLDRPRGVALDAAAPRAYVAGSDALFAVAIGVNPSGGAGGATAGERRVLSGGKAGSGVEFGELTDLMRLPEPVAPALAEGGARAARMYVTDLERLAVLSVADDGTRRVVSDATTVGPAFTGPRSIAFLPESIGGSGALRAAVCDFTFDLVEGRLFAVDLESGTRSILSGSSQGTGPLLLRPAAVAVDPDGLLAWVIDAGQDLVVEVDVLSGNRSVLSVAGLGPSFQDGFQADAVLDEALDRLLVVSQDSPLVVGVDLASGLRTVVSSPLSLGPLLTDPAALAFDGANLFVADQGNSSLLAVDVVNGARVLISK